LKKIEEVLVTTVKYLNREEIDYVFIGGIAVMVYGNPRTTVDLELVIEVDEEELEDFAEYLSEQGFFADSEDIKRAFRERTSFSAEEKDSLFRLDVKGVYEPKERMTLENRKKIEYEGMEMYVTSPEDTIAKQLYYGSEQDVEDAESIYVRQKDDLDKEYLEERCEALGVIDELEDMKKEVEELMDRSR